MLSIKRISVLIIISALFSLRSSGQIQHTPYDDLPGVYKSYKPAYDDLLPEWAKMLYQYPLNLNELDRACHLYQVQHPEEKSALIRYYKIWRKAVEPYAAQDGSIELPDMERLNTNMTNLQLERSHSRPAKPEGASDWTFLGPKETFWLNESGSATTPLSCPWQVNVYSLDVAASDPNVIYCGTETGFVNKTSDKGLHWQQIGQNYPFGGGIAAVAIHPADPNIVYVAGGNQVHRTLDGGSTWAPLLTTGNQFNADRLRIDPADPQKIFAASSNGLYVSTNGGNTWTKKWAAASWDVEIKPNDNSQVFALTKSGSNFAMVYSTDGGQNFQSMTTFPNNVVESSGGLLATTPSNPNMIMAILLSANNTPYLLKGTLSGSVWSWALQATGGSSSFPMNNGQGFFDLAIEISPVNQNIILVGTTTLYKSLNGGSTFSAVGGYTGSFNIHPDIQDIRMLANGDSWVATDGGMNLTTDNFGIQANYFVRVNGLMGSDMWGFDQGWNEDIVVGGRYHNGNTSLADFYQPKALRMGGAESPTGWVIQGESRHVAFNDLGNGWILPQTAEGKPEGRFIFSKYPNMDEYGGRRGNLVHHPNYYGTIYLGEGNGFWRSSDMGVTWDLLFDFPARVRYLQISYSNPDVIYADIVGGGLVNSVDGGITWESKPSLTTPPNGTSNWKGKLFFAISPYNENVIYACLQNGTWSADIGKVFKSTDGGDSWEDWTGTLSEYMKCMVIQPTTNGIDEVYLFTNATSGKTARVYARKSNESSWNLYSNNYPAGMNVNLALPFFRDSKLRVGGNGGVWESPMADTSFTPIINPWTARAHYECMTDTIRFDDHSMLNHSGVSWHWDFNPQPAWIESPDIRNPRVVLGNQGPFDVTLTVTKAGQSYAKTIAGMVSASGCPSIYDCNNPAELPKYLWSVIYADSEEENDPGLAVMSIDDNPPTIWHTRWSTGTDPYPHEIQVGLGNMYKVSKFTYLTRQEGENGRIKAYELYISADTLDWGEPVNSGEFVNTSAPQTITIDPPVSGRYFRLVALSEVNGGPWASAAEFSMVGCVDWPTGAEISNHDERITAFPVPSTGIFEVSIPQGNNLQYEIVSSKGAILERGSVETGSETAHFDLSARKSGIYFIRMIGETGKVYRVKVVKQ